MNHPGEIAPLAALIKPDCAIITNIGTAHIEYMKTREAIALEKGMLAEAVPPPEASSSLRKTTKPNQSPHAAGPRSFAPD
jgi:UDP-N-acetylmuramyl pentapeptide synthase